MKRDGDTILFDSGEQQQQFERSMLAKAGAERFMASVFVSIGKAAVESDGWWDRIRTEAGLSEDEGLAYDWTTRELRIRKRS